MKHFTMLIFTLISFARPMSEAWAYYIEVDSLSMVRNGSTAQLVSGGNRYLSQTFTVTNTGDESLSDVGVAWMFLYSGSRVFDYDSESHTWRTDVSVGGRDYGEHAVSVYTRSPFEDSLPQTYLSLSRDVTDLGLTGSACSRGGLLSLDIDEADEVPVFWIGDLDPGESASLIWYALQTPYLSPATGSGWSFSMQNRFVARCANEVPLAAGLWFLASGLGLLTLKRRQRVMH
ncbi:hypothetical protein JCM14469_14450 [Desulfatiferula olefinivorans]